LQPAKIYTTLIYSTLIYTTLYLTRILGGKGIKHYGLGLQLLILLFAASAQAADVVVVESVSTAVHQKIIGGINSVIEEKPAVISADDVGSHFGSKPRLFIAIGADALEAVKDMEVPVIFSMVMNPRAVGIEGKEITGVEIFIAVEKQLEELRAVLPKAARIGVVYDPQSAGYIVDLAKEAAEKRGFTFVSRAVHSSGEAIAGVDGMSGIDVFWMLPDTTVITREFVRHLMLLSAERKIPVYALSDKYVRNGALMALGINPKALGRQIGEMANRVLSGEKASSIPFEPVRTGDLYINAAVARRLGLHIPPPILRQTNPHGGLD
jgi:putative ABC transport system substrate-binding protein